ncbi:formate dehydrogenase accessory sulfurtransferase FdhD [uncultured Shewanella sp.]|uniref:formate dehydrogenase accessory sulfurtransferase FdhD n=1 Tax=uncultured Shewanella sp. TaxID=173975 RepID=UPI0026203ECF|nr:formate dehydrogenase accessory sulfurtransferase FdhD [uncultured Shewanella sp.]
MKADFPKAVLSNTEFELQSNHFFSFEPIDEAVNLTRSPSKAQHVPLVAEYPLSLSYNGINYAVMMVSPYHLNDFILGFSISEALITHSWQLKDIEYQHTELGIEASITINERAFNAMKNKRRQLSGRTGCGICGSEALEMLWLQHSPLQSSPLPSALSLQGLKQKITSWQQHGKVTGALHAALFVTHAGEILACREDVGRHNALDKLLGLICKAQYDVASGFVLVTSRCSYELVQKLVLHGVGTLACLSSPSSLAVIWAKKYNVNLIHIPKKEAARVYHRSV